MFNDFDDIGWAYFFLGDGCNRQDYPQVSFSLAPFSEDEANEIMNLFNTRYNTHGYLYLYPDGRGFDFRLNKEDSIIFLQKIAKYILPSHRYKLDSLSNKDDFMGLPDITFGLTKRNIYSKQNITDLYIGKTHKTFTAWDIEVADNHNYFVHGCLVHNCVVKNQTRLEDVDNRMPAYLKIVNESFKETMKARVKKEKSADEVAEEARVKALVDSVVTPARVEKSIYRLRDAGALPDRLTPSDLGTVAKLVPADVYQDLLKEEKEVVVSGGDKFGKVCSGAVMKIVRQLVCG